VWFSVSSGNENVGEQLATINKQLAKISKQLGDIMVAVQVDQEVLDSIGTELGNIGDAVQALVDSKDNPLTAADLSVITDPLARIQDALPHPELQ
jgi:hypothetical protein